MTGEIDDGGTAFPLQDDEKMHGSYGMSLRDWFAGQALDALINAINDGDAEAVGGYPKLRAVVARNAYQFADAMLAERKAKP